MNGELNMHPAALAALREVHAKSQIRDASLRFARGVDRLDRDLILSAFHPGALVDYNVVRGTPEEFCDWVIPMLGSAFEWATHLNANHLIELDECGTKAVGEVYVVGKFRFRKDGALYEMEGCGRYFDRYEERDGMWRIISRQTITDTELVIEVPESGTELYAAVGGSGARNKTDPSYELFAGRPTVGPPTTDRPVNTVRLH